MQNIPIDEMLRASARYRPDGRPANPEQERWRAYARRMRRTAGPKPGVGELVWHVFTRVFAKRSGCEQV